MPHHNTTHESHSILNFFNKKTESQDKEVMKIMKVFEKLTPSEVWTLYPNHKRVPLTSIRRSMPDLTVGVNAKLTISSEKRIGLYGRPEHCYKLV